MTVRIIAVPYDSGVREARTGRGPGALLGSGLAERLGAQVVQVELDGFLPEVAAAFTVIDRVAQEAARARRAGAFPLVLSGNCSASVGAAAALDDPFVLWFDAHGDFHTPETTRSGFLDGMAASLLVGDCFRALARDRAPLPPARLLLAGTRSVEPAEEERLRARGVPRLDRAGDLDAQARAATRGARSLHVHFDADALDPSIAPANAYAVPGGFLTEDVERILRAFSAVCPLRSATIASWDPSLDVGHRLRAALQRIAGCVIENRDPSLSAKTAP